MKKVLLSLVLPGLSLRLAAQCLTMTCPTPVNVNNDAGSCGAVVNFSQPTANSTCVGTVSDTFSYTGAVQTYTVPPGVTTLTMEVWGAQGGANWVNNVNYGGYVKGDIAVTPGEVLNIYVGQQPTTITGGFNGGGNGEGAGKGGGGGTDVRQGGTGLNNRVIVAGGGGGAGYWSSLHVVGGVGGYPSGGNGYRDPDFASNPGGVGGSQTAGGPYGTCVSFNNPAPAGGFGYGGAPSGCGCEGYGGGGGWYGGAGSGNCRGGGGGSGYYIPSATNTSTSNGVRVGNGRAVLSYNGGNTVPTITQTAGLASGALFPIGTTVNTFTASDAFGNTQTCSFNVTVTDNESPMLMNVPASITQNNDAGQCGANVSWTAPSTMDNCSGAVLTSNHNSGDMFPTGTTTVIYTVTDGSGNTAVDSFMVTVNDNEAPSITGMPSNITLGNDSGQCSATATWTAPLAADNCSGAAITSNHNSGDTFNVGTTTVIYTATDAAGNTAIDSFLVVVTDNEAPVLNCPAALNIGTDQGQCTASSVGLGIIIASDNCSTPAVTNDAPAVFPIGTTTVTWSTTDAGGNTTTCTQLVTVSDNEAPAFSNCPQDISMCPGVLTYNTPQASDNCSSASVVLTSGPASGSSLTPGNYTVTYTAMDSSGNSSTCSFNVIVHANPTVALNLGTQAVVCVDDGAFTLSGGNPSGGTWSGQGVSGSTFSPATAGAGSHVITYSYTDGNGCDGLAVDTIMVNLCTGISEKGLMTFSMYPNPTSGTFWFTAAETGSMDILDGNGQVVKRVQVKTGREQIDLKELAAGLYVVRFTTEKGATSSAKLLLQR